MPDLTCVGLTTLDILARPVDVLPEKDTTTLVDEIALAPAGTAGGTAVIAATLGLSTALVTRVGSDAIGGIVQNLLIEHRVDIEHVETLEDSPTSTTILTIRSDGERPNFHMAGASAQTTLSEAAVETAKQSKFFHFAGVGFPHLRGNEMAENLKSIRAAGTFVTCDLIGPNERTYSKLKDLLPHIDLFMPSEAEVRVLLGSVTLEAALEIFVADGVKGCIIKRGSQGAIGRFGASEPIEVPARPITPVDTTSCGDSFCAGVICGLMQGMSHQEAMVFGTVTASLVAQGLGTLGVLESAQQVFDLI